MNRRQELASNAQRSAIETARAIYELADELDREAKANADLSARSAGLRAQVEQLTERVREAEAELVWRVQESQKPAWHPDDVPPDTPRAVILRRPAKTLCFAYFNAGRWRYEGGFRPIGRRTLPGSMWIDVPVPPGADGE